MSTCEAVYAPRGTSIYKRCERRAGHRDNSTSVWTDADGCHYGEGVWWTNEHTQKPEGRES